MRDSQVLLLDQPLSALDLNHQFHVVPVLHGTVSDAVSVARACVARRGFYRRMPGQDGIRAPLPAFFHRACSSQYANVAFTIAGWSRKSCAA
ncbi:hypothetical protein bAD24_III07520 [Burkholderia sp. AD24]|nr:hypothetical protein bAD24_III07520 [Burkholderia sp. AD24]